MLLQLTVIRPLRSYAELDPGLPDDSDQAGLTCAIAFLLDLNQHKSCLYSFRNPKQDPHDNIAKPTFEHA